MKAEVDRNPSMSKSGQAGRFDRGARWHLILMTALLIFAFSSTIYRFTLPTDGWLSAEPESFDSYGFIYQRDIMGSPSALQPGDHLVAVGGVSLVQTSPAALWPLTVSAGRQAALLATRCCAVGRKFSLMRRWSNGTCCAMLEATG